MIGPDLTHLMSRQTIAAGTLANSHVSLSTWIGPGSVKPRHHNAREPVCSGSSAGAGRLTGDAGMSDQQHTLSEPNTRLVDGPYAGPEVLQSLERTWSDQPGSIGGLSAINHKTVARRFVVTTLAFFLLGGLLALAMRTQLARPNAHLVGPELYNQLFTMHGTTMMFVFAVPVMQAVATWLVLALRLERVGDLAGASAIRSHSYRSRVGGSLT